VTANGRNTTRQKTVVRTRKLPDCIFTKNKRDLYKTEKQYSKNTSELNANKTNRTGDEAKINVASILSTTVQIFIRYRITKIAGNYKFRVSYTFNYLYCNNINILT